MHAYGIWVFHQVRGALYLNSNIYFFPLLFLIRNLINLLKIILFGAADSLNIWV